MREPPNNKMQLTSGGPYGALRAPSSMRRLQLILVLGGPVMARGDGVAWTHSAFLRAGGVSR